ncbi:hypothetical protein, partial [Xanthomonas arboricola]|uniref:hypothetical protein n=1 Tax=Xanthomonas arboricola TaxID=56448 RepID=UPI003CCF764F
IRKAVLPCGMSRDGGRARTLQQSHTAPALQLIYPQSRRSSAVPYGMSAMMGGQRPCSQAVDQSPYDARTASGIMSR